MAQYGTSINNNTFKYDCFSTNLDSNFNQIVLDDLSNPTVDIQKQKNIALENNQKIMQAMFINIKMPQIPILPKNTKEVASEIFLDYVVKKNLDTMTAPLAKNILSPQQIINLGFDKEYQKFNLKNIKSFLVLMRGTHFIDENDENDTTDDADCIGTLPETSLFGSPLSNMGSDACLDNNGLSNHHMSFGGQTKEDKHQWQKTKESDTVSGILTHDLSKKCVDFIKNQGRKKYYDDIYSRFHRDDIIKTAYILDDAKLYDYLLQTGQITLDDIKKLPILGRNQTIVSAHYNTLISPEFMCEFLHSQKLINVHIYDGFLALFKDKPWFNSGGMQTLMQIIGGELITAQEVSFFIEWYKTHTEEFETLFDFFDIEADYSLSRHSESDNMRSKQITSDSIKAFYFSGALNTLQSANDPLLEDFFELDFNKTVENGFYKGLPYLDYLMLRGIDISKINMKIKPKSNISMTQKETSQDCDYLLNTIM